MRRALRVLSSISIRLMAFNLLLVFLPVAGILYLDVYERHLVAAQEEAMELEARLLATTLSGGPIDRALAARVVRAPAAGSDIRLRIVDTGGHVIADSRVAARRPDGPELRAREESTLYRVGAFLLRRPLRLLKPPEDVPLSGDFYEEADRLLGDEILAALQGRIGTSKRTSLSNASLVVLYTAAPIRDRDGDVTGAALVSRSTIGILRDLYSVRLGIFRIFLVSLALAVFLSLWVAATIVRPLRSLRREATALVDRRGRIRGHLRGTKRHDEIGELSRALETLTRRLDRHQAFVESFVSDLSHEFKNPLASIRTATEMIPHADEPEQQRRFVRLIEREIARLEYLLSGLRDVTLIDTRLGSEEQSDVDLLGLTRQVVESFGIRDRGRHPIAIDANDDAPIVVHASPERLGQVLENLLDNAIGLAPAGTAIEISLLREGYEALLVVADHGPGIPEEHLDRIFERFFTWRPDGGGRHSGLGLAIVRAIVEGYGGSIHAANRPGGGAIFELRLPLARRQ